MPQLEIKTTRQASETEQDVFLRLRRDAEKVKDRIMFMGDTIKVFDKTPAIQTVGEHFICRWHYKQYSNDSGASLGASKEK